MENEVIVKEVSCPKCGGHSFGKANLEKGIYCCKKEKCYGIALFCEQCNKVYPESEFGKHGDVYECKKCGKVHWGYTDMRRARDEVYSMLFGIGQKIDSISNKYRT